MLIASDKCRHVLVIHHFLFVPLQHQTVWMSLGLTLSLTLMQIFSFLAQTIVVKEWIEILTTLKKCQQELFVCN